MSLDGNRLGTAIFGAVDGIEIPQEEAISDATLTAIWKAVGLQTVSEFTGFGIVSTNTSGQATGVMPGGGVAPTLGTGTGAIS